MTIGTGCWKLGRGMIGIVCLVVIGEVAAYTGIWGRIVISVVTGDASLADMRASQNVIIIMDWKSSRSPVWVRGMTCIAGCRIVAGSMIRVDRGVIVRHMATSAGVGCVYVISLVTGKTVGCNGCMGTREGVNIGVIECGR